MKHFLRIFVVTLALGILTPFALHAAAPELISIPDEVKSKYDFNAGIYASVTDGETLYLGGGFTSVSELTGSAVEYNALTEARNTDFPTISQSDDDATVYISVPDGDGGWYIGGYFDTIGDETRNNLVHITASGDVDPDFNPDVNSTVRALALSSDGSILYVGGDFTVVNGDVVRNYIAAFTTSNGTVVHRNTFNPNLDGTVYALALSPNESVLYAGGSFTEVNGGDVARNYLASFSTSNGIATAFNPNLDDSVRTLALSSDDVTIYAGGDFTEVNGGTTRNYLAAFYTATGVATSFDPDAGSTVYASALSSDGSTLYVGGSFTNIGGESRVQFAALSTATGLATALDAEIVGGVETIYALALSNDESTVYLGGDDQITGIGGQVRTYFGAISTETGLATTLNPKLTGNVQTISYSPQDMLFIGGSFASAETVERSEVAAIDLTTYELTDFDPDVVPHNNNTTYALALSSDGSILYIGGNIDGVNGVSTRAYLASVTTSDGLITSFNPDLNGPVYTLALSPDDATLYAGGSFDRVNVGDGNILQPYLAAFATTTSEMTAFTPVVDGTIRALAVSSDSTVVYATGDSYQIQNFDAETGDELDLDVTLNSPGFALALSSDDLTLYVGGDFTTLSRFVGQGVPFDEVTQERIDSPVITTFVGDDTVYAVVPDGSGGWYVGGDFNRIDGEAVHTGLVHISSDYTVDENFDASIGAVGRINAMALSLEDGILYIGGTFNTVNAEGRYGLAALDITDGSLVPGVDFGGDITFPARPNSLVLSPNSDILYAGGATTEFGIGDGYDALFAFDTSDGTQLVFDPNVNSDIYAMDLSSDGLTLYIGGDFTDVNSGTTRNNIAAIDTATGLATLDFNPDVDDVVKTLVLNGDESLLYIGGAFTCIGGLDIDENCIGSELFQFAALNTEGPNTGQATSLDAQIAGPMGTVYALALSNDESTVYLGGDFTEIGGLTQSYFGEIDAESGLATDFDPQFDSSVFSIGSGNGDVYIGGSFTTIPFGDAGGRLVGINVSDGALTDFAPAPDSTVRALTLSSDDSLLYAGGGFEEVGGDTERLGLAAFDTTTGDATDFDPAGAVGSIYTLTLGQDDGELYVGDSDGALSIFDDEVAVEEEASEEDNGGGGGSSGRAKTTTPTVTLLEQLQLKLVELLKQYLQLLLAGQI